MPELPEVEVVRRGLQSHVLGKEITATQVFSPRAVRRQAGGANELVGRLQGTTFTSAQRRGKFLWLTLNQPGEALVVHLGMSGQMLVADQRVEATKHTRISADFADTTRLDFVDMRTFGYWQLSEIGDDGVPAALAHIAPDLLDDRYADLAQLAELATRLRKGRRAIKAVLLDQNTVSGIGNIYADEMLWRAHIAGGQPAQTLSQDQALALLQAGRDVLAEALAAGGTSFDALYVNVVGDPGYFSRELAAYGRHGQPCLRCGNLIVREKFANRSSHRCPVCQVWPID